MSPGAPARRGAGAAALLVLALAGGAAACTQQSVGPALTNTGDATVTVRSADGEVVQGIEPDGGAVVLTDDCLEAPLVVSFDDGEELTVDAPVCPGEELRIGDGSVRLGPSS